MSQIETHRLTVEPLGRTLSCRSDQTILDACLRDGVSVPHACTHGTCSTCKVKVLEGRVDHNNVSAFALMDIERDEGRALACTATPCSDLTIEADVDVEDGVEHYPVRDYQGRVVGIEDVARDTRRLLIELNSDINFNPGQYARLKIPGTGESRCYSFANSGSHPRKLELHIRRFVGGLASDKWIFSELEEGATIELAGPYGRFYFRPARETPLILIAGGTGLAPIKAIADHVFEKRIDLDATLYHGVRTLADLYCEDYFYNLEDVSSGRFRYVPVLSEESWPGRSGLVTEALAADYDNCRGHTAYVSGPPPMVDAALKVLMQRRLFMKHIFRENFFSEGQEASESNLLRPLLGGN